MTSVSKVTAESSHRINKASISAALCHDYFVPTSSDARGRQPALHQLSTPRAAAVAGVLFAILFGTVIVLILSRMPGGLKDTAGWLNDQRSGIIAATVLMPFAGISFLWFIGVVRDKLGRYEDRFFSTVFLGSGLLFLAMMFVATAVAAALVASNVGMTDKAAHLEVVNFGKMLVLSASKTYAIRMAAVFIISLATIWLRTGLMPRWLVAVSYAIGLTLLVASDVSMWLTLAFPGWVLLISVVILAHATRLDQLQRTPTD
jgi:hypothetical protein